MTTYALRITANGRYQVWRTLECGKSTAFALDYDHPDCAIDDALNRLDMYEDHNPHLCFDDDRTLVEAMRAPWSASPAELAQMAEDLVIEQAELNAIAAHDAYLESLSLDEDMLIEDDGQEVYWQELP